MLLFAAIVGSCSKVETNLTDVETSDNGEITFGSAALWTKGSSIDAITDIDELEVYSYFTTGSTAWEDAAADNLKSFFTDDVDTPFDLTVNSDGSCSYDGGTRYWPTDTSIGLSFMTHYPTGELSRTTDADSGKPTLSYTTSTLSTENHDLVVDALFDLTKDNTEGGVVDLSLQHALTKLSLKVKTKGSVDRDTYYSNDEYRLYGVTFHNLYENATLEMTGDHTFEWTLDTDSTVDMTASQGQTFLSVTEDDGTTMSSASLLDGDDGDYVGDYLDVMSDQKAIFVLPQQLGTQPSVATDEITLRDDDSGDAAPTVSIRILRSYYASLADETANKLTKITYESEAIVIPSATDADGNKNGWVAGEHNVLSFVFDLSNLSELNTPMTVASDIYDWTDAEVDVDVHPNVYIYANSNSFDVAYGESTADMYIYTNYDYDLRIPRSKSELDGSITKANGFTFYSAVDSYATRYIPTIYDTYGDALTFAMDDDGDVTANGTKLGYYVSDTDETFYDMSPYYATNVPGDPIPCFSWDHVYSDDDTDADMTDTVDWIKCEIGTGTSSAFNYYVGITTRQQLGLYTNSSVETADGASAGINKDENDAVYILRLVVNDDHLVESGDGTEGYFYGKIGAELLSNGGGMITNLFSVTLTKDLTE